jgi:hypothetical protein
MRIDEGSLSFTMKQVALVVMLTFVWATLLGAIAGINYGARNAPQSVGQGNVGCIGFYGMDFDPITSSLKIEIANIYGQRPCGPDDNNGE